MGTKMMNDEHEGDFWGEKLVFFDEGKAGKSRISLGILLVMAIFWPFPSPTSRNILMPAYCIFASLGWHARESNGAGALHYFHRTLDF